MGPTCSQCNEPMIGDGYTSILHCPYAEDEDYFDLAPDSAPVDCRFTEEQ